MNDKEHRQAVKATSQGGGGRFKYVSMADIVAAGYTIPATRIKPVFDNNGALIAEYMEWYDTAAKEWLTGSRIVAPEQANLGSKTQQYGAALSYARRYTIYMALGLVTDDDAKMEDLARTAQPQTMHKASEKQIGYLKKLAGQYYEQTIASVGGESKLTATKCSELIDYILKKKQNRPSKKESGVYTQVDETTPIRIEDLEH